MSHQKSRKEYQRIKLSETPLPKTIETCLWRTTGDCQKSMPELYSKCKGTCFAFIPYHSPSSSVPVKDGEGTGDKGDYQI